MPLPDELLWVQKILPKDRPASVIELGAHWAWDTRIISSFIQPGSVYVAVEADPRNVPILRESTKDLTVRIVECAIWNEPGEATFWLCGDENQNASSSIRRPTGHLRYFPKVSFSGPITVRTRTLDDVAAECYPQGVVDLLWCDIQGAEREMILGGQKTLERTAYMMLEAEAVEFYDGQALRGELLAMLPDWKILMEWPENANILLRNDALCG